MCTLQGVKNVIILKKEFIKTQSPSQGYVTEILLTLEASIDVLASELVFTDPRERCKTGSSRKNDFRKSTSNLYNIPGNACGFDNVKRHSIASSKMMENSANAANNGSAGKITQ